jgi:hypothetical protein
MRKNAVREMFEKYVCGTPEKAIVFLAKERVGILYPHISNTVYLLENSIFLSTRALKHLYDKRPAEEFDVLIDNFRSIINSPDACYRNPSGKRGNFCLSKDISNVPHFVVIEAVENTGREALEVVTAFRARHPRYLKDYELLWSRRDGRALSS